MGGLKRRESEEERLSSPWSQVSFPKTAYVMHFEDMTDVPSQGLAVMGINTLEEGDSKVKSCSKKGKVVERKELLQKLIVYTMEETSVKTFMRKLTNGETFQN